MRNFNRSNCDCFIRETVIDVWGRTVILGGRHAFEYSITIVVDSKITVQRFPNGDLARKAFSTYKRKRI